MSNTPTVFVVGATGSQGLNLCRQLRELNWNVRATVRNPEAPAARELAGLGVDTLVGDWDNQATLTAGIATSTMLFLNTVLNFADFDLERRQVAKILDIAKAAGVRHVVYSSSMLVDQIATDGIPGFDPASLVGMSLKSKEASEARLRASGFETWTILRGATFMGNFLGPNVQFYAPLAETGVWKAAFKEGDRLPLIDTNDIASLAVAAFKDPSRFHEKEIPLAGDALTAGEILAVLGRAAGKELKYVALADEEVAAQKDRNIAVMASLVSRSMVGLVSVEECRSTLGIAFKTFEEFVWEREDLVRETYKLVP